MIEESQFAKSSEGERGEDGEEEEEEEEVGPSTSSTIPSSTRIQPKAPANKQTKRPKEANQSPVSSPKPKPKRKYKSTHQFNII